MTPSRATRRRRAVVRVLAGCVAFVVLVAGGATAFATYLRGTDAEPRVERCAALLDGTHWYLAPDQAQTAALLSATSLRRGLPALATTIALATGLQESGLRNLDHGDRDSVGIFQQRPSQGWGTVEEIMDPRYATNAFYDALVVVPGYEDMEITVAAQTVQRSAFPDAYAQHEGRARAWASAMNGYSPAAVTCTLPEPDRAGDAGAVVALVEQDLGLEATPTADGAVEVDASSMAATEDARPRVGWATAHWVVAVAGAMEVTGVQHAGMRWDRATGAWAADGSAVSSPGLVRIVLAGG